MLLHIPSRRRIVMGKSEGYIELRKDLADDADKARRWRLSSSPGRRNTLF